MASVYEEKKLKARLAGVTEATRQQLEAARQNTGPSKQTQYEIAHFAECVRTGATPLTNGWDTLQGLRVIWKMYNAEKNGFVADLRDCALPE